jgi:hypothetical protein
VPQTIEYILDKQENTQRTDGNSTRQRNYAFELDGASGRRSPQFSTVWQVWKAPEGGLTSHPEQNFTVIQQAADLYRSLRRERGGTR